MSHTFSVALSEDPETLVGRARHTARQAGASFEGDAASGRFAAMGVEGGYAVQDGQVVVTVTRKPSLAPWPMVEAKLRGFFI